MRRTASFSLLLTLACASSPVPEPEPEPEAPPPPRVERTDEAVDLSGEWNDVDADAVAEALIRECMASPWAEEWAAEHGRKPVVRLHPIKNRTDGYIDYRYFTKQLEAALVNSRRVEVVSSMEEAADNRAERADQAEHASDETAKSQGRETGSDFILNGWILSESDAAGNRTVRSYLTSLELVETESNKKAWVGQKKIKKVITTPGE